jgi:hypothetical protein
MLEQRQVNREPTLTAVSLILERLNGRFLFITIPELLRHGSPQLESWYRWGDAKEMSLFREPDGKLWRYVPRVQGERGGGAGKTY